MVSHAEEEMDAEVRTSVVEHYDRATRADAEVL